MSTYKSVLPEIFPHAINLPRETAIWVIGEMTTPFRDDGLVFSSFAATADTRDSTTINLWLSEASWKFVAKRLGLEHEIESA